MLKTRILTALLLVAGLLLGIFLLPEKLWAVVIAAIVWFATAEWSRLLKADPVPGLVFQIVVALLILAFGFVGMEKQDPLFLSLIYICAFAFWWLTAPTFLRLYEPMTAGYWGYMTGVMIFVPAGVAMLELRHAGPWVLLAALAPVWLADIAAYSAGRTFGHHKLAPTISPGKTWEGVAGAVVAVVIYALVLREIAPDAMAHAGFSTVSLIAIFYTAMSVIGDLFESMMKRHAGVKDSGAVLPGHGGILDRIDSLLPTLPLAGALLLWLH